MPKKDPVLHIPQNFLEEDELKQLNNSDDIDKLRKTLDEGEVVYRLVLCFHKESDGVLAATNKRILFADKKFLGSKVESFDYSEVAAIAYKTELVTQTITLLLSTRAFTVENVEQEHGERFIEFVAESIGQDYTAESNGRVFKHNDDMINLDDVPSMQEDLEESI